MAKKQSLSYQDIEASLEIFKSELHALDDVVDSCYPGYPFSGDEARLECLLKLYEKMMAK